METKLKALQKEFLSKQTMLEETRTALKKEFVGIDNIIDDVIENVSSWYLFPDIQEKPIVINLWGLTGVGKTSLVARMAALLNFKNSFFRFDLGEKQGRYSFQESLNDLCKNSDDSPVIIALDEFQHAKTLEGPMHKEIENGHNRMIWELIDSGKVQYIDWGRGLWYFEEHVRKLNILLRAGIKVSKGIVVSGEELYCKEMKIELEPKEKLLFVSESYYEEIIEFGGEQFNLFLMQDVRKKLLRLSGQETLVFLNEVLKLGKRPSVKHFNKALIFVLGNLDEAYPMGSNFSADVDADVFHKQSLKITVPKIKLALQERFRDEQIARLGNIHIIYPALSKASYLKIIENELERYVQDIVKLTDIKVIFDNAVIKMAYDEGVYPTQGVRPILTSLHFLIKSKLPLFLSEIITNDLPANRLLITVENQKLTCIFKLTDQIIHKKQIKLKTHLGDIRKSRHDDIQAITAVHESGHAILSAILLHTIPHVIYSVTSDTGNRGFVYSEFLWNYVSRNEIIPRVASILGGYVAEELVFGKDHLTMGASKDITYATEFLSDMFKQNGMGEFPIHYSIPETANNNSYHNYQSVEEEIKQAISKALVLAKKLLTREKRLLLVMSDFLSDHTMLKSNEIEELINKHISQPVNFITNGDLLYYRNQLKNEVVNNVVGKSNISNEPFSLNKGK